MNWQEILTHELVWLGFALFGFAAGLGLMDLFINLFYGDKEDE